MSGTVTETYAAALQHDLTDVGAATLVGVVRRPTGWFRALVDENRPALGPPEDLLAECKDRQEALQARGNCEEEAHNAAWEETDFERRYRSHLEMGGASETLAELTERVENGESVALVCFEGEDKRCHRRVLAAELRERIDGAAGAQSARDGVSEHGN